jgi:hypothetical protein
MFIYWRGLIVIIVISVVFLMPALLLYYLGFEEGITWNRNAVETTCVITNTYIQTDAHPYNCNCTGTKSRRRCKTCYVNYYDGYIDVTYMADNTSFYKTFQVYSSFKDFAIIENNMINNYPNDGNITCYYNPDNPSDSKLNLIDASGFLVVFIILCVLSALILFGWLGYEYCQFRNK